MAGNSIFNLVKKLLPRIERSTVEEDLRVTEKECVTAVMPSWDAAAAYFKVNKLVSDEASDMQQLFYRNFDLRRASKAGNFVMEIATRVKALHENILVLQGAIDDHLEKDIITAGLTMRSAFVIRAAANMSLLTRYMLGLLNYLYTAEAEANGTTLSPGLEISKAEMKYIDQNFTRFVRLYSEYTMPRKDFEKLVAQLPDVFINDASANSVKGLYDNLDPMEQSGLAGIIGNPIYKVRLIIASWQNDRYNAAKEKKRQLELRLTYLQMRKEGQEDPGLEREIGVTQERIEKLDRHLRQVEEDLEI